jgi:hypothetical protein
MSYMTLHKIWMHDLELEVAAARTSSGYSVANPDLEVMSSRRVHNATLYHSARPDLWICYWITTDHTFVRQVSVLYSSRDVRVLSSS